MRRALVCRVFAASLRGRSRERAFFLGRYDGSNAAESGHKSMYEEESKKNENDKKRMGTSLRDIRRISPTRASLESRSGALDASTSPLDGRKVWRKRYPVGRQKKIDWVSLLPWWLAKKKNSTLWTSSHNIIHEKVPYAQLVQKVISPGIEPGSPRPQRGILTTKLWRLCALDEQTDTDYSVR